MNSIKFNETPNYTYMTVLNSEGVFIEADINRDTLPDGFHKYSLYGKNKEEISQISTSHASNHIGDFITKDPINLGDSGIQALNRADYIFHPHKTFDFFDHFGHHLSIDCQIRLAEEKRNFQAAKDGRENEIDSSKAVLDI